MRGRTGRLLCTAGILLWLALICSGMAGCQSAGAASNSDGLAAYQAGDYEKAIGLFNQAITQDGEQAVYYINRGMAQCGMARYEDALLSFETAAEKNPSSVNAYRGIGIARLREGSLEKAEEAFDRALANLKQEKSAQGCDILAYRAETRLKAGDCTGAVADYETLISYGYEIERIYLYMGYAYLEQNDVTSALICFQESINRDHRDFAKYLDMMEKLEQYGFLDEAGVVADAALSVAAKNAEERYYHGLIYLEKGDEKAAFAEFEQSYNAGFEQAGYYLGYCYELREQYSDAELIYQKQLTRTPQDARLYNQLAVCQIRQERYADALVYIKKGMELSDASVTRDLLWNQAICYERKKDFDTAARLLQEYLDRYPEDKTASSELAYIESR